MRPRYHTKEGQGLLEATMAIGIILLGLGAILTLTLQNVSATTASNQRVVALQLAREGIEVVRAVRDSNWLVAGHSDPARSWDAGLEPQSGECVGASYCGAAVVFTPPPSADPGVFTLQFVTLISRAGFDIPELQLYRGNTSHLWRQSPPDPSASLGGFYQTTGYSRAVMLDPLCLVGATVRTAADMPDCSSFGVGTTKVGYRVESQVAWPAPGLFGGARRRSLSLVEYIYNWR